MPAKASSKPARKASTRTARKAARPRAAAARRKPVSISVGDQVTCAVPNRLRGYRPLSRAAGAPSREYLSGIVCAIRDVRTGETVKVATGDLNQYVFEILDSETFTPGMSSPTNTDTAAARQRVQAILEKFRQGKDMPSVASGTLPEKALDGLDGWRIVKVHSPEVAPVAQAAAAKPAKRRSR